jgi:hypothetical protein
MIPGSKEEELPLYRPFQNMWVSNFVNIHVYMLTAHELKLPGYSSITPCTAVQLTGQAEQNGETLAEMDVTKARTMLSIYQHQVLQASIPGCHTMRIFLRSYNSLLMTSSEIGHVDLDLEDRWLTLERRLRRSTTNNEYLQRNVCCKEQNYKSFKIRRDRKEDTPQARLEKEGMEMPYNPRNVYWLEPPTAANKYGVKHEVAGAGANVASSDSLVKIEPKVAPPGRLPVEIVDMFVEDEDTGTETKAGVLRLWVDMSLESDNYTPAKLTIPLQDFEVRIVIQHIKNICVFRDAGERNDCKVKGTIKMKDYLGRLKQRTVETDVHQWATSEAAWNWRWIFKVQAPCSVCSLAFSLMDSDSMSDDDPIYDTKEYPLDHMVMLALTSRRDGLPPLGTLKEKVVFDSWTEQPRKAEGACKRCCCKCCGKKYLHHTKRYASLFVDITVIPQDDADSNPVEEGQISEPKGRMTWKTAISQPVKFMRVMLGPTMLSRVKCCSIAFCILACIIILLMALFFASQALAGVAVIQ